MDEYYYIHENIIEYFVNDNKWYECKAFFQEIVDNIIILQEYGIYRFFKGNENYEIFYSRMIGKNEKRMNFIFFLRIIYFPKMY